MRRAVVYAAAIALLLSGGATAATEAFAQARQQEVRERQCRYQWLDPGTWTAREERRTALCVLDRWSVPGGWPTFRRIIGCESGWYRKAINAGVSTSTTYVGLGQHMLSAWYGRVTTYLPDAWKIGPWMRWRNSRAMLATTAHMMHSVGLSPWSCA